MTRRCGVFFFLHQCCMYFIDSKCCSLKNSLEMTQNQFKLRLLELLALLISIASFESLLFYLRSINVVRRESFSTVNVNRAILIFSFISTAILLIIEFKNSKKPNRNNESRQSCNLSCLNGSWISSKCSFAFVDFIHSFFLSTAFLSCAFWMIVDIPTDYKHHLEVFLKIVGYLCDLFIGVLYAKSCIESYSVYEATTSRLNFIYNNLPENCSVTPASDENSSDEENNLHAALLSRDTKLKEGQTYAKVPLQ